LLPTDSPDKPPTAASLLRKRQIAAQSSILEVGYLNFQVWFAKSTMAWAAVERPEHEATTSTTSWLDRTSHTCGQCNWV
jgi:hypothetical protein